MADTTYEWTGPNDTGLPWPTEDSPPDGSAQIKKLAESIAIYGDGRPDDPALPGNEGDKYICTDPDSNFGAREWRYTSDKWICVEGQTPRYVLSPTSTLSGFTYKDGLWDSGDLQVTRTASHIYFRGVLVLKAQEGNGSTANSYLWELAEDSEARRWLSTYGSLMQPIHLRDYSMCLDVLPSLARCYGLHKSEAGDRWNISATIPLHLQPESAVGDSPGWPTTDEGLTPLSVYIAELPEKIKQAAEDNPELAEQLRQELEVLRSNDA